MMPLSLILESNASPDETKEAKVEANHHAITAPGEGRPRTRSQNMRSRRPRAPYTTAQRKTNNLRPYTAAEE